MQPCAIRRRDQVHGAADRPGAQQRRGPNGPPSEARHPRAQRKRGRAQILSLNADYSPGRFFSARTRRRRSQTLRRQPAASQALIIVHAHILTRRQDPSLL
jgi:hypothetical protein